MRSEDWSESWADDEWEEVSFVKDGCDHEMRCWRCGIPATKANLSGAFGGIFTFVVGLLVAGIVITPLLWLVRVCWSWAL